MKKIATDRLHNAEYLAMISDILQLIKDSGIGELGDIKDKLVPLVEQLDKGVIQVKKSEHTQKLAQLDKVRDDYLRGLNWFIKAELFAPESQHPALAHKVKIVLDSYKNLSKENFRKQSELLDKLIKELRRDDYQTAVQTLNLTRWLVALESANQNFINLYNKRRDDDASQEVIQVKQVRQAVDQRYDELVNLLKALQILSPSSELNKLITTINELTDKWQDTLAIRQGIQKKQVSPQDKTPDESHPPKPLEPIADHIDL